MGWNIDLSAITPGPGGTVMLGEGGIDAAARRYRERLRKQQEAEAEALARAKNGEDEKGGDAASEVTLTPEGAGGDNGSVRTGVAVEEELRCGEKQKRNNKEKEKVKENKKGLREAWRNFRGSR